MNRRVYFSGATPQVYLDLKGHPERAEEAAQKLRAADPTWRTNA